MFINAELMDTYYEIVKTKLMNLDVNVITTPNNNLDHKNEERKMSCEQACTFRYSVDDEKKNLEKVDQMTSVIFYNFNVICIDKSTPLLLDKIELRNDDIVRIAYYIQPIKTKYCIAIENYLTNYSALGIKRCSIMECDLSQYSGHNNGVHTNYNTVCVNDPTIFNEQMQQVGQHIVNNINLIICENDTQQIWIQFKEEKETNQIKIEYILFSNFNG